MERALGRHGDRGRWWNDPAMVEKLKLTDEQRKAMDSILMDHREKLIDLHANLEKAELVMDPLLSADQPDEQAILAQIDKVAMARAELEKANARFLLAIRAKLTPEQWKTLQADEKDHMRHRDRNWGPRRDGRKGGPQGGPPAPGGPQGRLDDGAGDDGPISGGLTQ
jgi:periplasmic protein CpxP/Spy